MANPVAFNPNDLVTEERRRELVALAASGRAAEAIRLAILESADRAIIPPYRHLAERQDMQEKVAAKLLQDSDLGFMAEDLGFPSHRMIHDAVKPILAKWIARFLEPYLIR